jgi:predicted phage terminase large subunit-like protein
LANQQTIELDHPTVTRPQRAFWDCPDPFRAFVGGVGSGKTRLGCLTILDQPPSRGMVVAPTYKLLRDATLFTFMDLARQGKVLANWHKGDWEATLVNGTSVIFRSGEDPETLRGPNLGWFYLDEAALMTVMVWNIMLGRLREKPGRAWLTTTPRGDNWIYERWVRNPLPGYGLVRSSTRDNRYLPPSFVANLEAAYTGRFARQEIEGDFLLDTPGALWRRAQIDEHRVTKAPDLSRIIIGVDPKASVEADSETGIVVVGKGADGHAYVLSDDSIDGTPEEWARAVASAYERHKADRIIVEVNQGGDMVASVLKATGARLPLREVRASRGKYTRAEPVAAMYEQGKIHHVGVHGHLEDQLCSWVPGEKSPDRLDALVWALTHLMLGEGGGVTVGPNIWG